MHESQMEPASRVIAAKLRAQILAGDLRPGEKFHSIRVVARTFGVAPMTAQSALRQLREEGFVVTSPGIGTFVRDPLPERPSGSAEGLDQVAGQLNDLAEQIKLLSNRVDDLEQLNHPGGQRSRPKR